MHLAGLSKTIYDSKQDAIFVRFELRKKLDLHISVALLMSAVWFALVLIGPYLVPAGHLPDLSGRVLFMDNQANIEGIDPVPRAVYTIGDFSCHQLQDRSYFLNGNELPFCARDVGIFGGLFIGALMSLFFVLPMRWIWLAIGLAPMIVDGLVQAATSYDSTNAVRTVTGMLAGAAIAIFVCARIAMPVAQDNAPTSELDQKR